jgi:hypothetical protein
MSEITDEDLQKLIKQQQRRIEMLQYEANILRAQKEALHTVLDALQGIELAGTPRRAAGPSTA